MSERIGSARGGIWARWVCVLILSLGLVGCASGEVPDETDDAGDTAIGRQDAGHDGGRLSDSVSEGDADDAPDSQGSDAGTDADSLGDGAGDDAEECVPTTCEALSACGAVSDGCGATLQCAPCAEVGTVSIFGARRRVLQAGETLDLSADARDIDGNPTFCDFQWTSLNPTVARVNSAGEVTGIKAGITEIRAECREVTDGVRLYVNDSGLSAGLVNPDRLALWLRADVGLKFSGGAQVKEWEDLSGNGRIFGHDDFTRHPRRVLDAVGGRAALRFTGHQELEMAVGAVELSEASLFVVFKNSDATHRGQLLANCAGGARSEVRLNGSPTSIYLYGAANGLDRAVELGRATTDFQMLGVVLSRSTLRVFQGAVEPFNHAVSAQGSWSFSRVGARCGADFLKGDIAEVMAYSGALSDPEIEQVRAYLQARYGL